MRREFYYFIVNSKSRTGRAAEIWETVKAELDRRAVAYQYHITEYKDHGRILAKEITGRGDDMVNLVVVGGDGTTNEVINGIVDFSRVRMGFIPTGSGNDLGRGLGLKGTPLEHLDRILNSTEIKRMDLGCVSWEKDEERRLFAISSGIGLDADVCKQALTTKLKKFLNAVHLGKLTYVLLTIKTLFAMETTTGEFQYRGKTVHMDKMICTVAMNLKYEGGGVPMAPRASETDGKLSFCCIHGIPKWRTFLCLIFLVNGKHEKFKGFSVVNCEEATIKLGKKMIVHGDGEYCGTRDELHFKCLPKALQIFV